MIRPAIGLVLSIGVASSLTGQSPDTMQVRGLTAYRALDYERAVLFLRAALVAPGSAVWVDTSRRPRSSTSERAICSVVEPTPPPPHFAGRSRPTRGLISIP